MTGRLPIADTVRQDASEVTAAFAVRQWRDDAPLIDADRILRVHRYKDPAAVRRVIRDTANAMAEHAAAIAMPEARWRRVPVSGLRDGVLTLQSGASLSCDAFERLLGNASEVLVFVLTLGARFDDEVIKFIDDFEPLEALFMEAAGWLMIERLTQKFSGQLKRDLAGEDIALGYRMGPGYSYRNSAADGEARAVWPLEQQQVIFGLFGAAPLPVELMMSSAMKPKMSRSGMFGLHSASSERS